MKKLFFAVLIFALLLSGCRKTDDKKTDSRESAAPKTSQSENKKSDDKKTEDKSNAAKKEKSEDNNGAITDKNGNAVTSEDLSKMIEKTNDPSTDEKTKQELLDEIGYILNQAEQKSSEK